MKNVIVDFVAPEGFEEVTGPAPFAALNGPFYEKIVDDQTLVRAFQAEEKHLNGAHLVHGGMLMAFADSALGRSIGHQTGRRSVTIKMSSEFMKPGRVGDWIEAHVEIIRSTKTVVFARCDLVAGRRTIFKADAIFHYVHMGR
ncbi:MAG: thioesterase [Sneathiella sp.]|nr:MAG: thioesterase [Sneathiella sp.]